MIIYPPLIADIIPAFTKDKIIVPFEHNPAVPEAERGKIWLIIKNYNSREILTTASAIATKDGVAIFTNVDKLIEGNYYKLQIAYNEDGAYSAVAVARCVQAPASIYIKDERGELAKNSVTDDKYGSYTGICEIGESEPLYSYRFLLKEKDSGKVIQDSNTQLFYNSNYTVDFDIEKELEKEIIYTLQFIVTSVNGLEIKSPEYMLQKAVREKALDVIDMTVEQDAEGIENGYVKIILTSKNAAAASIQVERTNDNAIWNKLFEYDISPSTTTNLIWLDKSIEQGVKYTYALVYKFTAPPGITAYSERTCKTEITPDFEHMFLTDGTRQLKIKYDPKVSNFKDTILETKTDTIGGKYPFFFRNEQVKYKEIPISGLISYHLDEENFFTSEEELGLTKETTLRTRTNSFVSFDKIPTTSLIDYNYAAERKFKLAVLDWLNNGQPKLFRSPSEGNYVVRLMNVSLSPNDTLGRMIHSFSTTGYECATADVKSLQKNNLWVNPEIPAAADAEWKVYSQIYKNLEWDNNNFCDFGALIKGEKAGIKIRNVKWELIKPNMQDYLYVNDDINKIFTNPTGTLMFPERVVLSGLTIHNGGEELNQDSASISFEYQLLDTAVQTNAFEKSVTNGVNVVVSIPINKTIAEVFGKTVPILIYTAIARRDPNAKRIDDFSFTIMGEKMDLSDGQIRFFSDVPFMDMEKGSGIHLDLYIRLTKDDIGVAASSELGKFILGFSALGGIMR